LTYVLNYGAAWSILSGHGWFLLLIAGLVLAGSIWKFRYLTEGYAERFIAVFLVFGGVFGNSIDRIWRGAVVDFLDFYIKSYHWPVFNVSDIAICCGVGIFMLSSLLRKEKEK
jgi:signal peptidase II